MPTLGLYIQIPFCASKCTFCNFSSGVERREAIDRTLMALVKEIERLPGLYTEAGLSAHLFALPLDSIYFGGGTPPLAGRTRLARVLDALRGQFGRADAVEFTMEMTPGSADEAFLDWARRAGINRLSIGAQSFVDVELSAVGRLHSAEATREFIRQARRAGFANVSLDLIAGLPHQTRASWRESLSSAARLAPEHLSVYLFEVDEKSRLGNEVLRHGARYDAAAVPDEDFMADAYDEAREFLKSQGYEQYEISNFARPGFTSRHNRKYWRREPVAGLGPGAHSFDGTHRWENVTSPADYRGRIEDGRSPIGTLRELTETEQLEEYFFLGLRECQGVDLNTVEPRWGAEAAKTIERLIAELAERELVAREKGRARLRPNAYLVSNEVFQKFLLNV
jgi:putative oxygen-independent coproporphyrinogen III oxidase